MVMLQQKLHYRLPSVGSTSATFSQVNVGVPQPHAMHMVEVWSYSFSRNKTASEEVANHPRAACHMTAPWIFIQWGATNVNEP